MVIFTFGRFFAVLTVLNILPSAQPLALSGRFAFHGSPAGSDWLHKQTYSPLLKWPTTLGAHAYQGFQMWVFSKGGRFHPFHTAGVCQLLRKMFHLQFWIEQLRFWWYAACLLHLHKGCFCLEIYFYCVCLLVARDLSSHWFSLAVSPLRQVIACFRWWAYVILWSPALLVFRVFFRFCLIEQVVCCCLFC